MRSVTIVLASAALAACQLLLEFENFDPDAPADGGADAAGVDAVAGDGAQPLDSAIDTTIDAAGPVGSACEAGIECVFAQGLSGPFGVATDPHEVFVSENTAGRIVAFPLDGGAVRVIATDLDAPAHLAVDDTYVYFGSTNPNPLRRALKTGVGTIDDFAECAGICRGVAVMGSSVLFTERSGPGASRLMQKDATGTTAIAEELAAPDGVAARFRSLPFAFADEGAGTIYVRGGWLLTLSVPAPTGLAVGAGDVWFTQADAGAVMRFALDAGSGGIPQKTAGNQAIPRGIAVAGERVFWANFGAGTLMLR